ncbi:hypothetical protein Xtri_23185 [Xanthomonas campestris pv. trichodesmae]|nr:hypothetical protein [Xanthomonas campestris pv. trichodesmae]
MLTCQEGGLNGFEKPGRAGLGSMAFESLGTFRMNEFTHVLVVPTSSVLQQCAHKFGVVQCVGTG